LFAVQANIYAVTLYDTVYLYMKLASEVLDKSATEAEGKLRITNGDYMYEQAKQYYTPTREYVFTRCST